MHQGKTDFLCGPHSSTPPPHPVLPRFLILNTFLSFLNCREMNAQGGQSLAGNEAQTTG